MPLIWRLTSPAYAHLLDGEGARVAGGRWNRPGRPVVYASTHLSLSVLEVFAHIPPALRDDLPELAAVRIAVPDDADAMEVSTDEFEALMAAKNPLSACRTIGEEWLDAGAALMLRAPSVLVPEELNVMLNPLHPRMTEVTIDRARRFRFDPRLLHR